MDQIELDRIATALERIADNLENPPALEKIADNLEHLHIEEIEHNHIEGDVNTHAKTW